MEQAAFALQLKSGKNLPFVLSDDWQKKVPGWLVVDAVSSSGNFLTPNSMTFP
ncbi:hypothetical protein NIES2100_61050 [Calothrix sp. NIES-2100]|uniref:hypothetical protein n=1 Tax=Calothrix sp. NIES-2100 TaxID=1954172 RepID=UPI000B6070DD|nr:hypothetical protein NIES2100_61050 [Calothrix sp. NIES-2100]